MDPSFGRDADNFFFLLESQVKKIIKGGFLNN